MAIRRLPTNRKKNLKNLFDMLRSLLSLLICLVCSTVFGQEQLTKDEAVKLTLENNFGIVIANNNVKIAENNKALLNSNFLPSLTGNAGASYDKNNQEATFQDATVRAIDGAETTRYNASLNLNYT